MQYAVMWCERTVHYREFFARASIHLVRISELMEAHQESSHLVASRSRNIVDVLNGIDELNAICALGSQLGVEEGISLALYASKRICELESQIDDFLAA